MATTNGHGETSSANGAGSVNGTSSANGAGSATRPDTLTAEQEAQLLGELERIRSYEEARGCLKVRLHPSSTLKRQDAAQLVMREVADGIAGLLVCDLGFVNISVPAQIANEWQRPAEELWAVATENVKAEGRLDEVLGLEVGVPLDLLASSSHFAASHLLFFEEYMPREAGYGALLAVPQRHLLVRHVIRDREVLTAAHLMACVIDDWAGKEAGEISRDLYWWKDGHLTRLPLKRAGSGLILAANEVFSREVLARVLGGD
ncbi:hypothetical protein [Chondromyces apiculatus]|nr:hypothetical protein [Chondromyces apiculatus]